jgi:hypothetical protein
MISTLGHVASSKIKDAFIPLGTFVSDGSGAAPIIFSNIPQNYKDLMLVIVSRSTASANTTVPYIRINDDSSGLYQSIFFEAPNSTGVTTAIASRDSANTNLAIIGRHPANNSTANTFGTQIVHINNYSSTSHFKTILTEYSSSIGAATAGSVGYAVSVYRSTNAVTSIRYGDQSGGNIVSGSTFRLYAIRSTN